MYFYPFQITTLIDQTTILIDQTTTLIDQTTTLIDQTTILSMANIITNITMKSSKEQMKLLNQLTVVEEIWVFVICPVNIQGKSIENYKQINKRILENCSEYQDYFGQQCQSNPFTPNISQMDRIGLAVQLVAPGV